MDGPSLRPEIRADLERKAKELGLWLLDVPTEHGGQGLGLLGMAVVWEEVTRSIALPPRGPGVFGPDVKPILFTLTTAQKEKYLYPVLRGEKTTAFAQSEPDAGSDPGAMRTTAVRSGDHYVINGYKRWITRADVADFLQRPPSGEGSPTWQLFRIFPNLNKPVVAAVGGPAVGIGCTMLLHCDLVYAAGNARFQLPFVPLGIVPEFGSTYLLPLLAGYQRAAKLLLLGQPFTAQEAYEAGIVTAVVPQENLLQEAEKVALALAALPPESIRLTKRLLPVTDDFHGRHFFTRLGDRWHATPLFLALLAIEVSDIVFAIDSVPAIFALTGEPLIVYTSNVFAILGLRSLYFVLAAAVMRFSLLKYGLAGVLMFVGLKMLWLNQWFDGKFPTGWSLTIILTLVGASIVASLVVDRRRPHPNSLEFAKSGSDTDF